MIEFELDVEDLADTRFAVSPIAETVFSLWALRDPGSNGLHPCPGSDRYATASRRRWPSAWTRSSARLAPSPTS